MNKAKLNTYFFRALWTVYPYLFKIIKKARLIESSTATVSFWYSIAKPFYYGKTTYAEDNFGHTIKIRPGHYVDLTTLFGRNEEKGVENIVLGLNRGDIFLDIGAHIGRYSLLAASKVGKSGTVISFEPSKDNAELLVENTRCNNYSNIHVKNFAIGSKNTTLSLAVGGIDGALNSLKPVWIKKMVKAGHNIEYKEVQCKKLDDVCQDEELRKIDLLKIDVEGAELDVLHGSKSLLKSGGIKRMVIEIHAPVVKKSDVKEFLKMYNYKITDCTGNHIYAVLWDA